MSSTVRIHRVLVADDDSSVRRVVEMMLKAEGHVVDVCSDGQEAIDRLDTGGYSLVIVDVMMPRKTGFDVVRAVRARGVETAVIIATSSAVEEALKFCEGMERVMVLPKPFTFFAFRAAVQAQLGTARAE